MRLIFKIMLHLGITEEDFVKGTEGWKQLHCYYLHLFQAVQTWQRSLFKETLNVITNLWKWIILENMYSWKTTINKELIRPSARRCTASGFLIFLDPHSPHPASVKSFLGCIHQRVSYCAAIDQSMFNLLVRSMW